MKYYYVTYIWRNAGDNRWEYNEHYLKNQHPIEWLDQIREGNKNRRFQIIFWSEVPEYVLESKESP